MAAGRRACRDGLFRPTPRRYPQRGGGDLLSVILCKKCGAHNEPTAEFCGGCGSFLEFTGVKIDDPAAAGVSQATAASAAGTAGTPAGPAGGASGTSATEGTRPARRPAVETARRPTAAPPTPAPAGVRPDQPQAAEPRARRPTDEAPKPVRTATTAAPAPAIVAKPGDLICGNCGSPNEPSRNFCRTCGRSLQTALPAARPPWWRRLLPARKAKVVAAGTRSKHETQARSGGGAGQTFKAVAAMVGVALVVFGMAGYAVVPAIREPVDDVIRDVQRVFVQPEHVYPTLASGASIANHPASLAIDKTHNLYWAGPVSAAPTVLDFRFSAPTDIVALIVTPGAEDDVTGFARPKDVRFTFSDGSVLNVTLKDVSLVDPEPGQGTGKVLSNETFNTNARAITGVRVEVLSVYRGTSNAVAIAEIEFFTKPRFPIALPNARRPRGGRAGPGPFVPGSAVSARPGTTRARSVRGYRARCRLPRRNIAALDRRSRSRT